MVSVILDLLDTCRAASGVNRVVLREMCGRVMKGLDQGQGYVISCPPQRMLLKYRSFRHNGNSLSALNAAQHEITFLSKSCWGSEDGPAGKVCMEWRMELRRPAMSQQIDQQRNHFASWTLQSLLPERGQGTRLS